MEIIASGSTSCQWSDRRGNGEGVSRMAKKATAPKARSARRLSGPNSPDGRLSLRSSGVEPTVRTSSRPSERRAVKGRDKVDLHADINLGVFGLLRPDQFTGPLRPEQAADAISIILLVQLEALQKRIPSRIEVVRTSATDWGNRNRFDLFCPEGQVVVSGAIGATNFDYASFCARLELK
jgi:hypothetical protein